VQIEAIKTYAVEYHYHHQQLYICVNNLGAHLLKMSVFSFAGDITQKGYEKKRTRLLTPYVPKQAQGMLAVYRSDCVPFNSHKLRNMISDMK
jgi:hypothetical protein